MLSQRERIVIHQEVKKYIITSFHIKHRGAKRITLPTSLGFAKKLAGPRPDREILGLTGDGGQTRDGEGILAPAPIYP